jgi:hypothetical protein
MELRPLIERRARLPASARTGEQLARPPGLVQRVRPGAAELHDLGAMDQARAPEQHQVWLSLAPAAHRGRPLLRPPEVERLLAGLDHGTVDDASGEGRELASRDGDHHLVEQCHALGDLAEADQRLAPDQPSKRHEVGVAEPSADSGSLVRCRVRGRGVARVDVLQCDRHEQKSALYAVLLGIVEQAPSPREPTTGLSDLALEQQPEAEPERAPCSSGGLALAQVLVVRAHPGVLALGISAK